MTCVQFHQVLKQICMYWHPKLSAKYWAMYCACTLQPPLHPISSQAWTWSLLQYHNSCQQDKKSTTTMKGVSESFMCFARSRLWICAREIVVILSGLLEGSGGNHLILDVQGKLLSRCTGLQDCMNMVYAHTTTDQGWGGVCVLPEVPEYLMASHPQGCSSAPGCQKQPSIACVLHKACGKSFPGGGWIGDRKKCCVKGRTAWLVNLFKHRFIFGESFIIPVACSQHHSCHEALTGALFLINESIMKTAVFPTKSRR